MHKGYRVMNRIFFLTFFSIFLSLTILITVRKFATKQRSGSPLTIGILQTASHPALDAVANGFMKTISELTNGKIQFVIRNGQGSLSNLHAMAISMCADSHISGFLAIATPATQTLMSIEKKKPIIFAAVSNPSAILDSNIQKNVSGSSDHIDIKKEIDLLQALVPQAQQVAIIFSPAEKNAMYLAKKMYEELNKRGMSPLEIGIISETDVIPAIESALRKADAIIAPTDNIVASSIRIISQRALQARKPLLVSDNLLVPLGPLAAQGVDYQENGAQAAYIAYEALVQKKDIASIPITYPATNTIFINKKTAQTLNIVIPETIKLNAQFITNQKAQND